MMPGFAQIIGERFRLEESRSPQYGIEDQCPFRSKLELGSVKIAAKDGAQRFVGGEVLCLGGQPSCLPTQYLGLVGHSTRVYARNRGSRKRRGATVARESEEIITKPPPGYGWSGGLAFHMKGACTMNPLPRSGSFPRVARRPRRYPGQRGAGTIVVPRALPVVHGKRSARQGSFAAHGHPAPVCHGLPGEPRKSSRHGVRSQPFWPDP